MPGQPGSETRVRTISCPTRWSPAEYARLDDIARYSGCSRAEVLRRLVANPEGRIFASRELVAAILRLGNNVNQIARRLNSGTPVSAADLRQAYTDLLEAATALS